MNNFFRSLKRIPAWFRPAAAIALLCLLPVPGAWSQPANTLAVDLFLPGVGGTTFHAPATIHLAAFVSMRGPAGQGDAVTVEFFANTNSLGKTTVRWHPERRPQPQGPQMAVPQHIIAAGFDSATLNWTNAPSGRYTLTARATSTNAAPAVSKPVQIVVTP